MKLLADIPVGELKGVGILGQPGGNPQALFSQTLSKAIGVMTVVGFIWFTFQVIIGAIRIISSGGDKNSLEGAKKQISTGVIGLVVIIAALFLVSLIGTILGVPNILNFTGLVGL